ncbi:MULTISPECIES: histone deacetylase family protein [Pandoraea]|uniref:Deacetylase n=1 Tax=Pandoraea communis TaxID=2508297 RepID=A0A5E4Z3C8_9BURK|nr:MULTISPECIES: histone deacetylase family protein [Pandoraea]EON14957.1 acetylspermidine deacetylase [Pandoraea sp. SD6-2]VVE55227.1 deacetylase [Pandoraea communis]
MATGFYTHPDCIRHEMGEWHPECPERLRAIEDQLIAGRIDGLLERREAPAADEASLRLVHTQAHIDFIRDNIPESGYFPIDPDTLLNPYSWRAATRAAGAAIAATDAVIRGELENAFCSVRPPGHHATPTRAMGFCLFNNVAIAAAHALEVHGLSRVAIVDFDVHHGNGTEAAFANDDRVLMCGIFQHPFYPFSGAVDPAPNMLNIPLSARTSGMQAREAIDYGWLGQLEAFRPEMIFFSAGFDAHREDDLGNLGLTEADFMWITERVKAVADRHSKGRIVSCLEGGYNLSALGRSVVAHLRVLADV